MSTMRILKGLPLLMPAMVMTAGAMAAEQQSAKDMLDASYLVQVFGSLLLVFGCIFGLVFLLKKMNGLPAGDRAAIRVLGSVRLGNREKLLLVQAGEQQLLVGVTPGSINTLHAFDEPIEGLSETAAAKGFDFAGVLGKARSQVGSQGEP